MGSPLGEPGIGAAEHTGVGVDGRRRPLLGAGRGRWDCGRRGERGGRRGVSGASSLTMTARGAGRRTMVR